MLTARQRSEFEDRGILHLRGAVDEHTVVGIRERIWARLAERHGVEREKPATWHGMKVSSVRPIQRAGGFAGMASPTVRSVLDELLGVNGWSEPEFWGQLLNLRTPSDEDWVVPHKVWHMDSPAPPGVRGLPGVQFFLFLEPVAPRGGGTLVATGAHRLVQHVQQAGGPGYQGHSAEVRRLLRRAVPWIRELWTPPAEGEETSRVARFMRSAGHHDEVRLQVAELTGDPGDVIFMHPWMLHTLSPNCGSSPRLVLTERVRAKR